MPQKSLASLPPAYRRAVGQAVADLRRRRKLTGAALASRAGIHLITVRAFESDGCGSLAMLHALASALGSTPADILRAAEKTLAESTESC